MGVLGTGNAHVSVDYRPPNNNRMSKAEEDSCWLLVRSLPPSPYYDTSLFYRAWIA